MVRRRKERVDITAVRCIEERCCFANLPPMLRKVILQKPRTDNTDTSSTAYCIHIHPVMMSSEQEIEVAQSSTSGQAQSVLYQAVR